MSILPRLSRTKPTERVQEVPRDCGHWELAPRWSCNDDIGKADKVTYYTCATCGEEISVERATELQSA